MAWPNGWSRPWDRSRQDTVGRSRGAGEEGRRGRSRRQASRRDRGRERIGFAVVERLLQEGATVLAVDVNEAGMAPLAEAGAETLVASAVTPPVGTASPRAAGPFDYLVNSAGVLFVSRPGTSRSTSGATSTRSTWRARSSSSSARAGRCGAGCDRQPLLELREARSTVEVTPHGSSAKHLRHHASVRVRAGKDGIRVNAILSGDRRYADAGPGPRRRGGGCAGRRPRRSTRPASRPSRSAVPRPRTSAPAPSGGSSPTRPAT